MSARTIRLAVPAVVVAFILAMPVSSRAQSPQQFAPDATRYLALGDSIAAGYKSMPVTQGYTYLLYQNGVFDRIPHTLFCNAAVPGATSEHLLVHQVPQALIPFADGGFNPKYITITIGGNDLLAILRYAETHPDPNDVLAFAEQVLGQFGQNLGLALSQLRSGLPDSKIFVANQYEIPGIEAIVPYAGLVFDAFNAIVAQAVGQFPGVYLVDVHAAFLGRQGLVQFERPHTGFEDHPTSVGHRVMAQAFADVINAVK